ncbi:MAG: FKBP-type peptidyl-prolyl cis-trans isomerase [Candidatus Diapherotrites archaeon]|nr:FKBP-type peptidyl-prolyl cis-trans isomerase [Candidatus Diapherotrites archaeon]
MKNTTLLIFSLLLISFFAGCTSPPTDNNITFEPTDDTIIAPDDSNEPTDNNITDNTNAKSDEVESGDSVSVDYVGSFEDGTVFDTSIESKATEANLPPRPEYTPMTFTAGSGQMIKGFDQAVIGMKLNETKTVTIPPEDAYGEMDPLALQTTLLTDYADLDDLETGYGKEIAEGDVLESPFGLIDIIAINDSNVTLKLTPFQKGTLVPSPYGLMRIEDANSTHMTINLNALLGETLVFEITVKDIEKTADLED